MDFSSTPNTSMQQVSQFPIAQNQIPPYSIVPFSKRISEPPGHDQQNDKLT